MGLKENSILITGGFGAIGSNLTNYLSKDNDVVVLDNSSSGRLEFLQESSRLKIVHGDIRDAEVLEELFEEHQFTVVFHLAANFANQNSVDRPLLDLETNGMGTLQLLKLSQKFSVKRFVFASSSGVYGSSDEPMIETNSGDLETPYYIHKKLGEEYCHYYWHQFALPVVIVRLFNSYGPGELWGAYRNVIPNFIKKALNGEPLVITGTGKETRDFTFVGDVVQGLAKMGYVENIENEIFNLGTGRQTSVQELAERINELTNNSAGIVYSPRRKWDGILHRKAVVEKAAKVLEWEGTTQLQDGLPIYVEWIKGRLS